MTIKPGADKVSTVSTNDDKLAAALRALGHPVRLGIMRRLAARPETCACDFTEVFDVRQPTISGHLKVLRDAELVTTRRRGTQVCYSVRPDALGELSELLGELLATPAAQVAG